MLTCRQRVAGDTVWCLCVCVCVCVRVYVCVYVLACRQESLRNDSGSEREAVGCVFGRTTENSEIIVHYGIFSIIDRTSYRGQNYRINTIIIVHLATLIRSLTEAEARAAQRTLLTSRVTQAPPSLHIHVSLHIQYCATLLSLIIMSTIYL